MNVSVPSVRQPSMKFHTMKPTVRYGMKVPIGALKSWE
jgi:hypothetical protein